MSWPATWSSAAPSRAQHAGGARVQQLALAERQAVVDGVAHERVHEAGRRLGAQDLGARERGHRARDLRLVEAGDAGHRGQVGALAEHGDGARDRRGLARQPREPQQDRARDGARADRAHDVGVRGVGLDGVGLERVQQLADEQRVAAGGPVAGLAERAVGLGAEPARDELRRRPPRDSGPGRTCAVAGSLAISASSAASVGGSPVRTLAVTSTGWPSSRRTR